MTFEWCGSLLLHTGLDADPSNPLSVLTIGFRFAERKLQTHVPAWADAFNKVKTDPTTHQCAVSGLKAALDGCLFRWPSRVVVVGAISSKDTNLADDTLVRTLGESISRHMNWDWQPNVLTKSVNASLHGNRLGLDERKAQMHGKYQAIHLDGDTGAFVVVDDFVTTGATLHEIRRALLASNRNWKVYGLALAKHANSSVPLDINAGIPREVSTAWGIAL